jgi:hypothetical protein
MLLMAPMRNRLCGRASATFLTLLLAGLVGCSTSSSGSTTPIPGTTTALATQLAQAFCAAQAACCGSPAGTTAPDGSTNRDGGATAAPGACSADSDAAAPDGGVSTCVDRATLSANQQLALATTAFGEGLLTISPTIATACVSAYASTSCAALAGQTEPDVQAAIDNPACANLFTGYIPVAERCDMTAECVSGAYCLSQGTGQNVTSIAGSGTLGVCFPFQGMGGACNTTDDCLSPLACNPTTLTCE